MSERQKTTEGYWLERLPTGETVFCFRVRSHGKTIIYKFTLHQLAKFMNDPEKR